MFFLSTPQNNSQNTQTHKLTHPHSENSCSDIWAPPHTDFLNFLGKASTRRRKCHTSTHSDMFHKVIYKVGRSVTYRPGMCLMDKCSHTCRCTGRTLCYIQYIEKPTCNILYIPTGMLHSMQLRRWNSTTMKLKRNRRDN
jgi:hypothetical protein